MKLRALFLFVIIVSTACGPATLGEATRSSPTPFISLSPTAAQEPSAIPTFLPSLTPTPGVSPLLPVLEAECFNDDPPAIEPPDREAKEYQLKPWSVEAAFGLIRTIDQNSPPCNQHWTGAMPVYSTKNARRRAAQLAVEEATLRYPDDPNRFLMDWRTAVNNALQNSSSSDEWLITQLVQALRQGRATPETLANFVQLYSFEVLQVEPAPNLFGDGTIAYVYWLSTHAGSADGLYFALRVNEDKIYNVYPLVGSWDLSTSVDGGFRSKTIPKTACLRSPCSERSGMVLSVGTS